MKKEAGKNMTIDDLALVIGKSFDHLEKELKGEIGEVKDRLGKVEDKLEKVEDRLEKVEDKLEDVEERLGNVEDRLGDIEGKWLYTHENRISHLEDDVRVLKTAKR